MKSRSVLLLPLSVLGLVSCMPISQPKNLSYNEAINYIKSNSKGEGVPKEGWLDYSCKDLSAGGVYNMLIYLGADNPISKTSDKKKLDESIYKGYINESKDPSSSVHSTILPLMYLTESNFKSFVSNDTFTYQLTYIKEFIITNSDIENTYVRYYNPSLRLTRFEIHNPDNSNGYDVLQTYLYN